ncbi:hypothetical protein, partial [Microbacterium sp.]|uniref:hypothetical protein n=1 Tax=Microbacterium sp. TaxID=51671 RepID=UPI003C787BCB
CCLAADRRRARAGELAAGALMIAAMLDAGLTAIVAPVWWAALLMASALVLAAGPGRVRRRMPIEAATGGSSGSGRSLGAGGVIGFGAPSAPPVMASGAMAAHAAAGMIVMAALLLTMATGGVVASPGHGHAHTGAVLWPTVLVLCGAYIVASAVLAARARATLDRAQYVAMAASVALMALAPVAG